MICVVKVFIVVVELCIDCVDNYIIFLVVFLVEKYKDKGIVIEIFYYIIYCS